VTVSSPDPVREAAEYQRLLLSLLGDDDPAQVQARTPTAARELVEDAAADLRRRPAAKEWSALELVGHLHDAEIVMSARYRWALSHDRPPVMGYDQDLWVDRLRHNAADPKELLGVFATLRAANLRLWQRASTEDRARVAMHAERGPESYDLMFRMIAGHDRFHLNQAQEALRQVREAGTTA
jgi:DinB family protein